MEFTQLDNSKSAGNNKNNILTVYLRNLIRNESIFEIKIIENLLMSVFTTEITSTELVSDNPVHQRLLYPYVKATDYVKGNLLEIGCGEGRGIELLLTKADHYTGIDKNKGIIENLSKKFPSAAFINANIPPMRELADNSFDSIVSFHVIEHIKDDGLFVKEIHRLLKPGGVALLVTPNIKLSLTRNPWHIREYTAEQFSALMNQYFDEVEAGGLHGNKKVKDYHEMNRKSVAKITRFDIFNLQYNLPRFMLKIPYDILNRVNRNKLSKSKEDLVTNITVEDFYVDNNANTALDLFYILRK